MAELLILLLLRVDGFSLCGPGRVAIPSRDGYHCTPDTLAPRCWCGLDAEPWCCERIEPPASQRFYEWILVLPEESEGAKPMDLQGPLPSGGEGR